MKNTKDMFLARKKRRSEALEAGLAPEIDLTASANEPSDEYAVLGEASGVQDDITMDLAPEARHVQQALVSFFILTIFLSHLMPPRS